MVRERRQEPPIELSQESQQGRGDRKKNDPYLCCRWKCSNWQNCCLIIMIFVVIILLVIIVVSHVLVKSETSSSPNETLKSDPSSQIGKPIGVYWKIATRISSQQLFQTWIMQRMDTISCTGIR